MCAPKTKSGPEMSDPSLAINTSGETSVDNVKVAALAVWFTVIGSMAFLIMPSIVGAIADSLGFTEKQLGYLASSEMAGMAIASGSAVFWVRKVSWRLMGAISLGLLIVANLASSQVFTFESLITIRFFAGVGGGAVMAIGLSWQSDGHHADRLFAIFLFGQITISSVGLYVLSIVKGYWGVEGVFLVLGGLSILAIPTLKWAPHHISKRPIQHIRKHISSLPLVLLALFATLLFFTAQGGVWAFLDRIGNAAGYDAERIGLTLAIGSWPGVISAALVIWLIEKWGRHWLLLGVAAIEIISYVMLDFSSIYHFYFLAICGIGLCWSVVAPIFMGLINRLDTSGRLIALFIGTVKLSYAIGPAIMGNLVNGNSYLMVYIVAGSLTLLGLAIAIILSLRIEPAQEAPS